jgi:hypothetical protein
MHCAGDLVAEKALENAAPWAAVGMNAGLLGAEAAPEAWLYTEAAWHTEVVLAVMPWKYVSRAAAVGWGRQAWLYK